MERSRQWAVRCMHEASLYDQNCFITLTYNEAHLPDNNDLDYREFQLFMKRLRKKAKRKIKFFMCGEYGDNLGRPHYHACIFNFDFNDRVHYKTGKSGCKIYTSKTLDALWSDRNNNPLGFCTVGDVNPATAGYVARYVLKKRLGHGSDEHYKTIDMETGEVLTKTKEFNRMSLKPGVGKVFYDKYKSDMFPLDVCVVNGVATKPPKYYFKKLKEENPEMHDQICYERETKALKNALDNLPERLEVKEVILREKIKLLNRELH